MQISCSTAHTTRLSSSIFIDPCAYSIKFEQNIKCRGGYIKLISCYVNQKKKLVWTLHKVSKNLLQPLLLLALGTSDSHIKRVFNLVKTRLNRFKRPNNFEFCFGDHICTYLCWTVSVSPQSRFVIAKRFGADGNSILHSWVQVPMSSVSNQIRSKQL